MNQASDDVDEATVGPLIDTATVLYPGDMGCAVARRLCGVGCKVFSHLEERSPRTQAAARRCGVLPLNTLEDAVAAAALVISLVPQGAVLETAAAFSQAAQRSGRSPLYLDANSVAPSVMAGVRGLVENAGAECVDGSFVGSAQMLGDRTTLYVSGGPGATSVAAALGKAFRTKIIGTEIGLASAFKLFFSGFNKGLVALFLEMMAAADCVGRRDEFLLCLRDFYPEILGTIERLLPTYPAHGERRAKEMGQLESSLGEMGRDSVLVEGLKEVLSRFAGLQFTPDESWTFDRLVQVWCQNRLQSIRPAPATGPGRMDRAPSP